MPSHSDTCNWHSSIESVCREQSKRPNETSSPDEELQSLVEEEKVTETHVIVNKKHFFKLVVVQITVLPRARVHCSLSVLDMIWHGSLVVAVTPVNAIFGIRCHDSAQGYMLQCSDLRSSYMYNMYLAMYGSACRKRFSASTPIGFVFDHKQSKRAEP